MKALAEALAKKAVDSTVGADAHQFAEAARNVAESLSIIEHMEDCQADRKLRVAREKREEERAEERHALAMRNASNVEVTSDAADPKPTGKAKGADKEPAAA